MVRRAYANPTCAYDSGYFCWDYCYGADIDNSHGHVAIDAGMEKNDFSGHVYSPTDERDVYRFYTLCVLQRKGCKR